MESKFEGSVDVGDIWPDPVDAVAVEFFMLDCIDGATPDVDDEDDNGLLDIDGVTVGGIYIEPAIPPRITVPTGTVKVEAPTVQQLPPQQ